MTDADVAAQIFIRQFVGGFHRQVVGPFGVIEQMSDVVEVHCFWRLERKRLACWHDTRIEVLQATAFTRVTSRTILTKYVPARIMCRRTQLLLNPEQLVVFRYPIAARQRSRFDLTGV